MEKSKRKQKLGWLNILLLVILSLYTLSLVILFLWGVMNSLKSDGWFFDDPVGIPKGWPWDWEWKNFSIVWKHLELDVYDIYGNEKTVTIVGLIFNSFMYSGVGAFVMTAANMIAAYLVAKYAYTFSKIVYTVVLVTMVIPIVGNTPSMLLFLQQIGLLDTFWGTWVMKFNFLGMYFLVFHASFKSISPEFSEAATIDGASEWQVFTRIMIPLVIPTFSTIFLIKFIEFWNDYQTARLYLPSNPTLAYAVQVMGTSRDNVLSSIPIQLASAVLLAGPLLILFIALRNKIMGNVTMGGVKE